MISDFDMSSYRMQSH